MKNLKTFEQFSNEETLDEGLFSKSFKEKYKKLDKTNENDVEKFFTERFPEFLQVGAVRLKYKKISLDNIKKVLEDGYNADGLESDRLAINNQTGELVYKPVEKTKFGGKTRLGN